MSVVLTEESRTFGRQAGKASTGKKHTHKLPQKTFTAQPTPRKALGDLSNNAQTPAPKSHQKKPLLELQTQPPSSLRKPAKSATKKSSSSKGGREALGKAGKGHVATSEPRLDQKAPAFAMMDDEFPDIETMPLKQGGSDDSIPPFVPPNYFQSLTSALRMTRPLPFLTELPELGSLATLSLELNVRPRARRSDPVGVEDLDMEDLVPPSLPPVSMPEIPDWTDN